ncbi:ABC transporter permease [Glaciimonas sp. PCH181]|nr:ABC transporter permease [Glaciimonas sp. PCH181]
MISEKRVPAPTEKIQRPRYGMFYFGLAIVLLVALMALLVPYLPLHSPDQMFMDHRLEAPSAAFWFGTDDAGRDILSRVIWGARTSLWIGTSVVAIGMILGVASGLFAGFYSGSWTEEILMKIMEILASIPLLIWAIAVVGILGTGATQIGPFSLSNEVKLIIVIGVLYSPSLARLTHTFAKIEVQKEYVAARRIQGAGDFRLMFGEILPNCIAPVLIQACLLLGIGLVVESSLSFIGLGVQPPTPSWGGMLSEGRNFIFSGEWWVNIFPGGAIFLTVLGFNLIGDGLQSVMNPRRVSRD